MDKIAILIPCYNESASIRKVVLDWKQTMPDAKIYVYDNNSDDNSGEIAREAGAIVRIEPMQGKGNVVRRMFREIDAECYIIVDGDDTYPAEAGPEIARLVLTEKADMVIGDRLSSTYFTENKRPFHNVGNTLTRFAVNRIFHSDIRDIMTGLRGFSLQFAKSFPVLSKGFEVETEMTMHACYNNMHLKNLVINYRDRLEGSESKLNTFRDGFQVICMILRLFRTFKPFRFFSVIAFILFLLAVIFFIPIWIEYQATGLVPRFPTVIVCGIAFLAALLFFLAGIVLETMLHRDRQDFEFRLQVIRKLFESSKEDMI